MNTHEKAAESAQARDDCCALIIRGHGTITVDQNLHEACLLTLYLEGAAKRFCWARSMGTPKYFSEEESSQVAKQVFKE